MVRILIALVLLSSIASADGIVLESYTVERPADAPRLLAPVLAELAKKGYSAGDTVARNYEGKASRSAQTANGLPGDFAAQVDRGFKAWVAGRFTDAIGVLQPLIKTAQENTGAFAVNPAMRDTLLRALIALALAYKGTGDLDNMKSAFAEIVRSFPDAQVSRATYGPDAQTAFDQVRKQLQAAGHGKLTVKVADDAGVVFINEAYRAAGSTSADLPPGEYRVVVIMNKQASRNHVVDVRANAETVVEIDPKLDQSVRTVGFTGFLFPNQTEREVHEAPYAAKFAKAIGASACAVIGIDDVKGRASVVGTLISLQTGRELRRASIPIEPDPSNDKLRALARFLAGEEAAPGLDVQFANPAERLIGKPHGEGGGGGGGGGEHHGPWGGWRYVTAGAAVGAFAFGGVYLYLDKRCREEPPAGQTCSKVYDTAKWGYIGLGGGAVLAGISIYLFATYDKAPVVAPTQGGATVGFATRF